MLYELVVEMSDLGQNVPLGGLQVQLVLPLCAHRDLSAGQGGIVTSAIKIFLQFLSSLSKVPSDNLHPWAGHI